MAFLVSFDDSDNEHVSSPAPSAGIQGLQTPSIPQTPTKSKPIPLQLKPNNLPPSPPNSAPSNHTSINVDTPPSTPLSVRMQDMSISNTRRSSPEDTGRRSIDSIMSDAPPLFTPDIKEFPLSTSDYTVSTSNLLGEGLWSNVYLAHPVSPGAKAAQDVLTPPLTPVKTRSKSNTDKATLSIAFAIKTPTSKSARNVLTAEARILSHLTALPGASSYIIPFYGQDTRNGALVLGAMPATLENYIFRTLNNFPESTRADRLAAMFPSFALRLLDGMKFLHSAGVVHADLKPSNILLETREHDSTPPTPFYADFSSSIPPPHFHSNGAEKNASPLGGGTWDFLSPILLKPQMDPTPRTDIHALAISFLFLIFGASPFDSVGSNVFLRREMVKQNQAINAGLNDTSNWRRLQGLTTALKWDVRGWIEMGLGNKELDLDVWREELVRGVGR